jgi:hypothetical protein
MNEALDVNQQHGVIPPYQRLLRTMGWTLLSIITACCVKTDETAMAQMR